MKSNPRITRLKELMGLEERRAALQEQLDTLINQMSSLKDALFEDSTPSQIAEVLPAVAAPARAGGRGRRRGRTPRGELKSQIVSALTAAGASGVRVTELAKSLGLKPVNVHSWFHSAMRRFPEIKKLDRGQYRLEGGSLSGTSSSGSETASTEKQSRSRVSRGSRGGTTTKSHSRRGELSKRILEELTSAGAKGVNVRELAEKIGAPYKNIYIWFATTGKKNAKVKKLAPATYKLTA